MKEYGSNSHYTTTLHHKYHQVAFVNVTYFEKQTLCLRVSSKKCRKTFGVARTEM